AVNVALLLRFIGQFESVLQVLSLQEEQDILWRRLLVLHQHFEGVREFLLIVVPVAQQRHECILPRFVSRGGRDFGVGESFLPPMRPSTRLRSDVDYASGQGGLRTAPLGSPGRTGRSAWLSGRRSAEHGPAAPTRAPPAPSVL